MTVNGSDSYLTTAEVAERTGLSLRQLQWWTEQGVVSPLLRGGRRCWTAEDVRLLKVVRDLRARRLRLERIRPLLPAIREHLGKHPAGDRSLWINEEGKILWDEYSYAAEVSRGPLIGIVVEKED